MRKYRFTPALAAGAVATLALAKLAYGNRRGESLDGKVALITGGSKGLGFILAREFARAGCKVAVCARDEEELNDASRELEREGHSVYTYPCDLTKLNSIEELFLNVTREVGSIDILVNNAGMIQVAPLENTRTIHFEEAQKLMFWAPLHATMLALPTMREKGEGHIVNITSFGGTVSVPHLLPYNCAKFAAVGLSEGLQAELKKDNIHVTTVIPSTMRTGSYVNAIFGGDQENEYRWFTLGASLPLLSTSAERSASAIVAAVKKRQPVLVLGLPARLGMRLNALFPNTTARLLALVNRLLPKPSPHNEMVRGWYLAGHDVVTDKLSYLGKKAVNDYQIKRERAL